MTTEQKVAKRATGDKLAALFGEPVNCWECPCAREHAKQPRRTLVSLLQPRCPFCGQKYKAEWQR